MISILKFMMLGLPLRNFYIAAALTVFLISCMAGPWSPKRSTKPQVSQIEHCDPWDNSPQMVKLPVFSRAWQIVESCDRYPREAVSIAMVFFYMEWHRSFGDDGTVWKSLDGLMIEWSDKKRTFSGFDSSGRRIKDATVSGTALTPGVIWVKSSEFAPICETSLVHELVHIAIWNIKGTDGDPDHLGKKYSGWTVDHSALIQRVNDQLCVLGI